MNRINVEAYDRRAGRDLCELTLTNRNGVVVKLLSHGATLERVLLPTPQGGQHDAIMHLNTREDYARDRNFLGGTVGRVIGRMRHGEWQEGSTLHRFECNDGPNHAHGGPHGYDTRVFDFRLQQGDHAATVTFSLFDAADTAGYPGNVRLEAAYTLDDADCLTYRLHAVSDAPTPFNPANHVYFNLGDGTVAEHVLQLAADRYLPLDAESIPTLGQRSVAGTAFDFREGQPLATALDSAEPQIVAQNGLNHPFLLTGQAPAAVLTLPGSGRSVTMATTQPAIVVYTANHFDHTGVAANLGRYSGVALEAQFPPTADPTLNAIVLVPGAAFDATTSWTFGY
ncbi:aldose epimerase family protein [Lacticaseibacillus parakribbianus]|uniref:aldose epimerase family protein n=1 Tax=Lacticaseibacillus parakribbianus TaxID=2970927 RepID=UPI0021CB96B1|nr:aldose epimerase family protein [Lacticaseibacillus parakribbianus]